MRHKLFSATGLSFLCASIAVASLSLMTGCKTTSSGTLQAISTTDSDDNTGETETTDPDFYINASMPTGSIYTLHKSGDWTQPCKITSSESPKDLYCILEVQELDVYYAGSRYYTTKSVDDRISLKYSVPAGMCQYFKWRPYYYWRFEPGVGPTAVTQTIDMTTGAVTFSGTGGKNASVDSAIGTCTKDYTTIKGPNCCVGTYTFTKMYTNPPAGSTAPSPTVTINNDWGGDWSSCLDGVAADTSVWSIQQESVGFTNKFPRYAITNLADKSLQGRFKFGGGWWKNYLTNVYSANYFDPSPASSTFATSSATQAIKGPGTVGGYTFPTGQPWYEFACMDNASDVVNRIRIMVRPWSSSSEYVSAMLGGASDWKLSTPEGIPFSDQQTLDFPGWSDASGVYGSSFDFTTQYPGLVN